MNITNTTNNIDSNTVDLFTIIIEYIEHNHQPIIYTTIFLTIILLSFCTCYFIYTEIHDKYNAPERLSQKDFERYLKAMLEQDYPQVKYNNPDSWQMNTQSKIANKKNPKSTRS